MSALFDVCLYIPRLSYRPPQKQTQAKNAVRKALLNEKINFYKQRVCS